MKKKKNKAPYIIIMAAAGVLWALVIVMIVVLGVPDKVNAARVGKQIDLGNKYLAEANYDKAEVCQGVENQPEIVKSSHWNGQSIQ